MKSKMRALIIAISACLLLTACGASPSSSPTTAPAQASPSPVQTSTPTTAVPQQTTGTSKTSPIFVSAEWVHSLIEGNEPESDNYLIVDVGFSLFGMGSYDTEHIPGSVFLDCSDLESPENLNNLFPAEQVETVLLNTGITKDTCVVFTSVDWGPAVRAAFCCLWMGVEDVRVLDGYNSAWLAAGYEMETTKNVPVPATDFGVKTPAHPEYLLSMPEDVLAAQQNPNFRLVSTRSWEEFIGETSGYDFITKTGEPQGAVWGHGGSNAGSMEDFLNDDLTVKDFDELLPLWEEWDITKENSIAFYCGTGWRACIPFLMSLEAGWENVSLYDGGWYCWQLDDSLPVQIGDPR